MVGPHAAGEPVQETAVHFGRQPKARFEGGQRLCRRRLRAEQRGGVGDLGGSGIDRGQRQACVVWSADPIRAIRPTGDAAQQARQTRARP